MSKRVIYTVQDLVEHIQNDTLLQMFIEGVELDRYDLPTKLLAQLKDLEKRVIGIDKDINTVYKQIVKLADETEED